MCAYFAKIAYNKSAICLLCQKEQLTRTHIFMNCEVNLECYRRFQITMDGILNIGPVDLDERAFGLKLGDLAKKQMYFKKLRKLLYTSHYYRSRSKVLGRSCNNIV